MNAPLPLIVHGDAEYPRYAEWKVTGVTTDGKRFRRLFTDGKWAIGINLYRGTVWCKINETWRVVYRIWN